MKKKILLVISKFPPEYSGPGIRIPRFYDWLQTTDEQYRIEVLCNGIEQTTNEKYEHKGMPVRRVSAAWTRLIMGLIPRLPERLKHSITYQVEFFKTLIRLMLDRSYRKTDLLHIAGYSGGTAATLLWAKLSDIPVLLELVTAEASHRQKIFSVFRTPKISRQKVIALTEDMAKRSVRAGLPDEHIWCRPNPIDEKKFHCVSGAEKAKYKKRLSPFNKTHTVLVSVAKMIRQKNQLLILKTLPKLPEHFVALIAGPMVESGPLYDADKAYLEEIKSFIKENKLKHRVHLVNDFVEANEYMKAGDLYMMPAWNEGFGTPMLEAMACGLPVIGNKDEPAFCEWIKDNENGALCDIEKPEEWAQAIKRMSLMSDSARHNMSKAIHNKAGQLSIHKEYLSIIQRLIN
jgi:glycosyltransferase involved in cell wall biosynthesis